MAGMERAVEETLTRSARIEVKTDDIFNLLSDDSPERGASPLEGLLEEILIGQMRQKQGEVAIAGTLRSVMKELQDLRAEVAALRSSL